MKKGILILMITFVSCSNGGPPENPPPPRPEHPKRIIMEPVKKDTIPVKKRIKVNY